jgi:hypothetical protein
MLIGGASLAARLSQIDVTSHAGIVHPAVPALRYFLPQIRERHIGSVPLNQSLLSVLATAPAFRTRQANNLAGIFAELERAGHVTGNRYWMQALLPKAIKESMSVPFGNQAITALVGVLIVLVHTPANATDNGLGHANCGSLTPQQCRVAEIFRAQLMLQSARVYAAQPQLSAPSLSRVFAGGDSSNVVQRPRGASRQKLTRKSHP